MGLSPFDVVQEDGSQVVVQAAGVGDPAAVRGPHRLDASRRVIVGVGVHQHGLAAVEIHDPEVQALVGVGDPLAVRRPGDAVVERRAAQGQGPRFAEAVLIGDDQLILPVRVGQVGHVGAVGGPRGVAVVHAHRTREVAHVAVLGGHGEDLAAGPEHRTHARGRDVHGSDERHRVLTVGSHVRQVRGDVDVQGPLLARVQVQLVQAAGLLVHDGTGVGCGVLDVHVVVVGEQAHGAVGAIRIDVHGAGAVGEEHHLVARPDGPRIGPVLVGDLHVVVRGQVEDPHRGDAATAVALPGLEGLAEGDVGHAFAVGGDGGAIRGGHGHGSGHTAPQRHGEDAAVAARLGQPPRPEQHGLAFRGPPAHGVLGGVEGQSVGLAALHGHHVHVGIAVVVAGECHVRPVRGEEGVALHAGVHRQPARVRAVSVGDPHVAGVHEGHVVGGHRWRTQEERGLAGRGGESQAEGQGEWGEGAHLRFPSPVAALSSLRPGPA